MFSPAEYYNKIVRPTAEELFADCENVRLAMLACMATLHVVDYVFQNRAPDAKSADDEIRRYTEDATKRSFAFAVVKGFALASKHCRLREPPHFHSKQYMITCPSFAGTAVAGATFVDDTVGGITVQWTDSAYVNLVWAIKATHEFFEDEFSELKRY